jgi:hypothetical protein
LLELVAETRIMNQEDSCSLDHDTLNTIWKNIILATSPLSLASPKQIAKILLTKRLFQKLCIYKIYRDL